jgi:hypothetical protein
VGNRSERVRRTGGSRSMSRRRWGRRVGGEAAQRQFLRV